MTEETGGGSSDWREHRDGGFIDSLGPLMVRDDHAVMIFGLQTDARHVNRHGVVHGGVIMSFIDHALGVFGWEANGRRMQVTMQLGVNFVAAVSVGAFLVARCELVRQTRSVMFLRATVYVDDEVAATGEGIWKLKNGAGERSD